MSDDYQVKKYDRIRGGMHGVALFTKPSTIKNVQNITGESETFVIETARHAELGDFVFIEMIDRDGIVRVALPPKASDAIASQRDSLTTRRRSIAGKRRAAEMKEKGVLPGFMRKGKHLS